MSDGNPLTRPAGEPTPDWQYPTAKCPHCDAHPTASRLDEHIREEHADLPACTARLDNQHGLFTCAFRAGHKDGEYGDWHASAWGAPAGRTVWSDGAAGAVPHRQEQPMSGPTDDLFVDQEAIADAVLRIPKPEYLVSLREDDGTLIVGIRPDGSITTGPTYQPDAAAREFWDAITRAAQAASPIPIISKENSA